MLLQWPKVPQMPLAPTDLGTWYGDVAITSIRVLLLFARMATAPAGFPLFSFAGLS